MRPSQDLYFRNTDVSIVRKEKSSQVAKKMVPFDKTRFFLISENLAHHRPCPQQTKKN
jgi:hypothetical protein